MTLFLFLLRVVVITAFKIIVLYQEAKGTRKITFRELLFLAMGAFLVGLPAYIKQQ